MEGGPVACPVCTLYLREGISMSLHLDTHPKDQVIDALVRLYSGPPSSESRASFQSPPPPPLFHMVSEEQTQIVTLGRQVTSFFQQAPVVSFPFYPPQPQFALTPDEFEQQGPSSSDPIAPIISIHQDNGFGGEIQDLSSMLTGDGGNCHSAGPCSPASIHSSVSIRVSVLDGPKESREEYITSDNYREEPLPGLPSPGLCEEPDEDSHSSKEEEEDERAVEDSCDLNTDERMPPHGELSGQGSVSVSSVWMHEESRVLVGDGSAPWEPQESVPVCWSSQVEENRGFACLYCGMELSSASERRIHIATEHANQSNGLEDPKKSSQVCKTCGLELKTLKALRIHIKSEHKNLVPKLKKGLLKRQCTICKELFENKTQYDFHLKKVHPLECTTCGKTFTSKGSLELHAKIHLDVKPHRCSMCDKSFITTQKLREHINSHTGYAPLQCNLCDKRFRRYSNLKQHKDSTHLNIKKKTKEWFCDCGESFPSKKKLAWHKETHSNTPKQCSFCSERYVHEASLTRHIRRSHDPHYLPEDIKGKTKNVQCPVCNMVFVEGSLRSHLKQHSLTKPYGCVICGKKFLTRWNLKLHRWTHAARSSKPFKCNQCQGAFVRLSDFQAHIRSHLGHKPFTCNHCGLQFNRKQNWVRHEREHTNTKLFECNLCNKTFHRSYYLEEHSRMHTGVKPYSCHICNKSSSTKSNHNKHVKTHHAREPVNTEG